MKCHRVVRERWETGIDHIGMLLFPVAEPGWKRSAEMLVNSVLKEFWEEDRLFNIKRRRR